MRHVQPTRKPVTTAKLERVCAGQLLGVIFVQFYEVAECDGKFDFLGRVERVESQAVLQAYDNQRETKRVEPRIEKPQIIREGRHLPSLLLGDLLELRYHSGSHRHAMDSVVFDLAIVTTLHRLRVNRDTFYETIVASAGALVSIIAAKFVGRR